MCIRDRHKGQCDGPSTYRAEKVDKVIEQLLRGIIERAKRVDEKTILKMLVDASAEQCQQELDVYKRQGVMKQYKVAIIGNGMICNAAHIPAYKAMGDKVKIDVYKRQVHIRSFSTRSTRM